MIPLVCENLLCGAVSPNMVAVCLRNIFKWVNNSRQRVRENYSSGTISPDLETACLRILDCLSCLLMTQMPIRKTPI